MATLALVVVLLALVGSRGISIVEYGKAVPSAGDGFDGVVVLGGPSTLFSNARTVSTFSYKYKSDCLYQ